MKEMKMKLNELNKEHQIQHKLRDNLHTKKKKKKNKTKLMLLAKIIYNGIAKSLDSILLLTII